MTDRDTQDVPVLLLVFNRPNSVERVLDALRGVRPKRLYVAADGPRAARAGEKALTDAARAAATAIDWPCQIQTLFRDENLGCRRAVSEAIDWFFEKEEEGIILEDDCVPDPSYFQFANELLARYRDDARVMIVGANHFQGAAHQPPHSYYFSRYNHCWGWASWRRAWRMYDREMSLWPALRETGWLLGIGNGSKAFQRYWAGIFDQAHAGKVDSWAYRWTFSCWSQSGLSILPARNLVQNIGFDSDATHTIGSAHLSVDLEQVDFPLVHPPCMVRDAEADAWTDLNIYLIGSGLARRLSARRILGVLKKLARD